MSEAIFRQPTTDRLCDEVIISAMSTKSTIWFGTDDKGRDCHLYWELADRIPGKAAPIHIKIEADGKATTIRLPKEIAQQIREILDPHGSMEVL